jgi:hypothetical protein
LERLCAREGAVGHEGGRAGGGLEWRDGFGDDLATVLYVAAMAAAGVPEAGHPGLMGHDAVEPDGGKLRAMVAAVATGDVHHRCRRFLRTVVATSDRDAGAIERGQRRRQPEALSR